LNQELDHRLRECETLRRELEVYKGPRKNPVTCNFNPTNQLNVIKICNKRFEHEKKHYLFLIWRLRYQLVNETKFKLRDEAMDAVQNKEDPSKGKNVRFDFDDYRDIGIATSLADGVLRTLKYMREQANGIIFELFVRSANSAEQKKT
jgi:hypothetical protein